MDSNRSSRDLPFVAPIRLRNLVWLPFVGSVWLATETYGTPHLRAAYSFTGSYSHPYYRRCDYWGLHSFRLIPQDGLCPVVVMARADRRS